MSSSAKDQSLGEPPTVVEAPAAVPRSAADTVEPLVQVLDERGHLLRAARLTHRGLMVGRSPDNDLVLGHATVSRRHARVDWDGQHAMITDLDSENGTWLAAVRLPPNVPRPWLEDESVGLGACCLMLRRKPQEQVVAGVAWQTVPVEIASPTLTLTPGHPTTALVTISNVNPLPDEFGIEVHGVPEGWVRTVERRVAAEPGQRVSVLLAIEAPRLHTVRSGDYAVSIRANSSVDASASGVVRMHWIVEPFQAAELRLRPARIETQSEATYVATIQNLGNAPVRYALDAAESERVLRLEVTPREIRVHPGEVATAEVRAIAPRYLVGFGAREYRVRARAIARPQSGEAYTAQAEFAHVPVFRVPSLAS